MGHDGTAARERGSRSRGVGERLLYLPPAGEVPPTPQGEARRAAETRRPTRLLYGTSLCRSAQQTSRRGEFVGRPVPPRRDEGPGPRGRSHRQGRGEECGLAGGAVGALGCILLCLPFFSPVWSRTGAVGARGDSPKCGGFHLRCNCTFMIQFFSFFIFCLFFVVGLGVFVVARPLLVSS